MNASRAAKAVWTSALLLVAAGAFATPGGRAADVNATLSPDSVSGLAGHRSKLPLRMDMGPTGKSLGSYAVAITWDSTVVRLDSVRAGDFAAPAVNFVNAAEVRLTQASTSGLGGSFALAQLYFRFVSSDTTKRTVITPAFSEVTATDFTNLMPLFAATGTVARVKATPVTVKFTPDSLHERVGFRPIIDLTADLSQAAGVALGSWAASFTWDTTVMRLDSVKAADFAAPEKNQPNGGELRLTAADAQGRSGVVALARLFYSFLGDSFPRTSPMTLAVTEMHAAISFEDLLPGATVKSGKAVVGGVLRGDIDLSGLVAALDAQVILQGVVGLALPAGSLPLHGDADCNGALKARDAQLVLNQVVGNDVSAFCVGRIQ